MEQFFTNDSVEWVYEIRNWAGKRKAKVLKFSCDIQNGLFLIQISIFISGMVQKSGSFGEDEIFSSDFVVYCVLN